MTRALKYPLNIQLFGEEGQSSTQAAAPQTTVAPQATTPSQTTTTLQVDYEKLAGVVAKQNASTEDKALQGYFKQQGLSPEQASEAINQYKQAQATKQQQEAQALQTMQNENAQLKAQILNSQVDTKIAELASGLGIQAEKIPFLNKLVDRKDASKEDGTLNDDNIKTAIETVLKAFPDFKSTTQAGGFQQIGNTGGQMTGGGVVDSALDAVFGIKKK